MVRYWLGNDGIMAEWLMNGLMVWFDGLGGLMIGD